ncbi:CGNR zinc finger domain-containing protein [Streptomyces tubercidicus]|uniref:CGNR zinc finger domain-containing protein n=1 Tax=Streptomyces tubercidicus TaxID=47759 RepID=UPI00375693FA
MTCPIGLFVDGALAVEREVPEQVVLRLRFPTCFYEARAPREVIHRAGIAIASGGVPDPADEELLNRWTARHRARLVLTGGQARWHLPEADPVRAARAVVALDAVATLGGHVDGVIKRCEQRTCGGLFVDTSRGRRRRWCSMATCGNKMKKANLKAARDEAEAGEPAG